MKEIKVVCNSKFQIGRIDNRIYGSFAEHMGRVVYGGIYDKGNPLSDDRGFRQDVIDAIKGAGITQVRYPGGNFVSNYIWEDGVGPVEKRPSRLDLAWKALETNEFGTDEFMQWTEQAGVSPILAVNLGTRGITDAVNYLEYCNLDTESKYSRLRKENGHDKPYGVKVWCLGNEMDGEWQIGHKTANEYGRLAAETSKAMKIADPSIETVICGSSLISMPTFPSWEATVLDETYDFVDYISLHQYFGGQEKGTEEFLNQADDMLEYIDTVQAVIQYVKAKKRSSHKVRISIDEWGVWTHKSSETDKEAESNRWAVSPAISEMIYSFEDTLLFAEMLMTMIKKCDVVSMACQSLIANISSMIMVDKDGIWYQPIYYPFSYMARFALGKALQVVFDDAEKMLDIISVYNESDGELVIFAVNRNESQGISVAFDAQGYRMENVVEHIAMTCDDKSATNYDIHDRIRPVEADGHSLEKDRLIFDMPSLSWSMIRVKAGVV